MMYYFYPPLTGGMMATSALGLITVALSSCLSIYSMSIAYMEVDKISFNRGPYLSINVCDNDSSV